MKSDIDTLIEEIAAQQEAVLLSCAKRIVPHVVADDLLQPNDFPELEEHPHFRYEEGVLMGIRTVQMALRAAIPKKNANRSGCGSDI